MIVEYRFGCRRLIPWRQHLIDHDNQRWRVFSGHVSNRLNARPDRAIVGARQCKVTGRKNLSKNNTVFL